MPALATRFGRSTEEPKTGSNKPESAPWWIFAAVAAIGLALIGLYGWSTRSTPVLAVEWLIAVTALSSGGLLGFLFGIPRGSHIEERPAGTDRPLPDRNSSYAPSTNLETISDWLTKILIGVGLVELRRLGDALASAGSAVATSLGGRTSSVAAVTQAVILTFAMVGFLCTYLWTRLHYGGIQTRIDMANRRLVDALAAEANRSAVMAETVQDMGRGEIAMQGSTEAAGHIVPADVSQLLANWPAESRNKLNQFLAASTAWDSDPVADIFGPHHPAANKRALAADLLVGLESALVIRLSVRATEGPPMEEAAVFLLHPTFQERVVVGNQSDACTETKCYAEGWFTAGAVVDQGRTILTYDLRQLPGAPEWFKR
jgi:hypothetical protein